MTLLAAGSGRLPAARKVGLRLCAPLTFPMSCVHNKRECCITTTTVLAQNNTAHLFWPCCSSHEPRCFLACHCEGPPAYTSTAPAVFANSLCRARRKRHLAT